MRGRASRAGCPPGRAWGGALLLALAVACRDATGPFQAGGDELIVTELPRQLTFSPEDDRSPSWDPDGSAVLYATRGRPPFPPAPGLLVKVPAGGGTAEPVLPDVQEAEGARSRFGTPTLTADGGTLALSDLWFVASREVCPAPAIFCDPADTDPTAPELQEVILHARPVVGAVPFDAGERLHIVFEGSELVPPNHFRIRYHPFHQLFSGEGVLVYRPSWAPDGRRLAFSDGLRLLIWELGGQAREVPGTADGVSAAWSPDGEWIAFTRLVRGDSILATCTHLGVLGPNCTQERVVFPLARSVVTLVRPDGSETREMWEGGEPAWTPDGRLVFRRDDRLWVGPVDGGAPAAVPDTEGGREPAVSPDGTAVAFSRVSPGGGFDIWLAELGR